MGSFRALSIAGAIAFGAIGSASAADLLPPPPPLEPPMMSQPVEFGGWYLRADTGVGFNQISGLRSSFVPGFNVDTPQFESKNLTESGLFGVGLGYQFNGWFRGDVTAEYRSPSNYTSVQSYGPTFCATGRCYDGYRGTVQSSVFLANGYLDLGTWSGFTPYVGVGLGMAHHRIENLVDESILPIGGIGFGATRSTDAFAWAIMAGASYSLASNLKLDIGYRYLDMGTLTAGAIGCPLSNACGYEQQKFKLASHDIRIGLRYTFADMGVGPGPMFAPSAPGPLVRKY